MSESALALFAQDAAHLDLLRGVGVCSCLSVPLVAREQPFGVLTLAMSDSGRQYTTADLDLTRALAERVATAIDNARIYRDRQEAVHVRDEFLPIDSHELKTPSTSLQPAGHAAPRCTTQGTRHA